jgi:hypothetical protein
MLDTRQTNRVFGEEWYTCGRCGMDYPRGKVIVQNGLVVCRGPETMGCVDEPGAGPPRTRLTLPLEQPIDPLPEVVEDL